MTDERSARHWTYMAVAAVGGVAIWAGPTHLLSQHGAFGLADQVRLLLRVLAASLAMVWTIVFATMAYRAQDEFTREASKFAWYWGGAVGAAVSAPIFVFFAMGGADLVAPRPPPPDHGAMFQAFAHGYMLLAVCLAAGSLAARLWWSLAKR